MDKHNNISIYCYTANPVYVEMPHRQVMMVGGSMDVPAVELVTFEELEYINIHSNLIKSGRIEFDKTEREEIYAALKITDWQERCLFEGDIDGLLMGPTLDTMVRIVGMTDIHQVDRIRGHIVMHENAYDLDISTRVRNVVNARYKELLNGYLHSSIKIERPQAVQPFATDALNDIVAQKVAEQLAAIEAQKAKDKAKVEAKAPEKQETHTAKPATSTGAKRGRPAGKTATANKKTTDK